MESSSLKKLCCVFESELFSYGLKTLLAEYKVRAEKPSEYKDPQSKWSRSIFWENLVRQLPMDSVIAKEKTSPEK